MARPHLSSGDFFGAASRTVEAGGFRVGLWIADRPPESVVFHAHDDAHFILALDDGYCSLAHDPLTPRGAAFGPGALVWNPPGVEHRDCFTAAGGRFLSISFDPPKSAGRGDPMRLRGALAEGAARRLIGVAGRFAAGDAVVMEGLTLDLAAAVLTPGDLNEDPAPEWLLRAEAALPPNVFALYEENVGGITPLIADELKDAEERYPPQWIEAAFREAVSLNKRSWRYIHSILKRWEAEGPDHEEAGRDPEADWLERRYQRGKRPRG